MNERRVVRLSGRPLLILVWLTACIATGGTEALAADTSGTMIASPAAPVPQALSVTPASVTFPDQPVGTTSTAQVTLANTGTAALIFTAGTIAGANAADFSWGVGNCPDNLAPGVSCQLTVTFRPTGAGARTASLRLTDNAAGSPHSIGLSGNGTSAGLVLGISPTSVAFGSQPVGTSSAAQTITLTNAGAATITFTNAVLSGTNAGDFSWALATCGSTLAGGSSCTLTVTFKPTASGARSASLVISDNAAGSPQSIPLAGTGGTSTTPSVGLSPTSIAFGSQLVGKTSAASTVALTNSGGATLTISAIAVAGANAGDFARTTTCGSSLAAGASCTISVTFTPSATGSRSAAVSITDNAAGSPHTVSLSGTGSSSSTGLTLSPASVTFASQAVGTTSPTQPIAITNNATSRVTFNNAYLTGTNAADFTWSVGTCGNTLAAGASCNLTLAFKPKAAGTRSASLVIVSTAAGSPHSVTMTGTATSTSSGPEPGGWFAGDMHVHRSCGYSTPESISSVFSKMSTNNLAVVSLLADMGNAEVQDPAQDLPRVNGSDDPVSTTSRILHWDTEFHWDPDDTIAAHRGLAGHVTLLGINHAQTLWSEYSYPAFDFARQHGGMAGYVHMQYLDGSIPQTFNCCGPLEFPVEVALGTADFIEEDLNSGANNFLTNAYYALLNSGFRPGLAAGTDYPCAGTSVKPGDLLTYSRSPDGTLSYGNWIDGIKKGRTVISRSGHTEFLDLTVDGTATPGDEIQLTGGRSIPVTVTWSASGTTTGTIELLVNGVVMASKQGTASSTSPLTLTTEVYADRSGWLAARRVDSSGNRKLHTAAVFAIVNGAPIRASQADAEYFVQWIDNLIQKASVGGAWSSYYPTSRASALARFQAAKAIFQQIAAEAAAAGGTGSAAEQMDAAKKEEPSGRR